eukprot:1952954-Ditylum_brightwellii.AAC.1
MTENNLKNANNYFVGKLLFNGLGSNAQPNQTLHIDHKITINQEGTEQSIVFGEESWSVMIAIRDEVRLDYVVVNGNNAEKVRMIIPKDYGLLFQGWNGASKRLPKKTSERLYAYIYNEMENEQGFNKKRLSEQSS